jgi:hypothetical protein
MALSASSITSQQQQKQVGGFGGRLPLVFACVCLLLYVVESSNVVGEKELEEEGIRGGENSYLI